jgi:hypothetical protein
MILLFLKTNHILFNFLKNKLCFIQFFQKSQSSKLVHQIKSKF